LCSALAAADLITLAMSAAADRHLNWNTPLVNKAAPDLYKRQLTATDFAREHGHPVCDLAARLGGSFDSFYDEVHFNTAGSRKVAKELLPCVADALRGLPLQKRSLAPKLLLLAPRNLACARLSA